MMRARDMTVIRKNYGSCPKHFGHHPFPVGGVPQMTEHFYAHTKDNEPLDRWQPLEDHLKQVAELTRSFADEFGAGDWGYLAGL